MKVVWFPAVHSFDVETFEISVSAEFFWWLEVFTRIFSVVNKQFQNRAIRIDHGWASVNWSHFLYWVTKTKTIVERTFQTVTLLNFHELMEIRYNFQRPSSSKSPLRNFWKFLSRKEEVVLLKIGLVNRTQKKPNDVNQSSQQAVTLWTEFQNKTHRNYGAFFSLRSLYHVLALA